MVEFVGMKNPVRGDSIDWTKPVETTETPPRPVRVLATDLAGLYPVIGIIRDSSGSDFNWRFTYEGRTTTTRRLVEGDIALRNVAPKPVLHEAWIALYDNGYRTVVSTQKGPFSVEVAAVEVRRIVWNSDGSPVESSDLSEDEIELEFVKAELQKTSNLLDEMTLERDRLKCEIEAVKVSRDAWIRQCEDWAAKATEWTVERDNPMWNLKCEDMTARKGNPSLERIIAMCDDLGDTGMPPDETGDLTVDEVEEMLDDRDQWRQSAEQNMLDYQEMYRECLDARDAVRRLVTALELLESNVFEDGAPDEALEIAKSALADPVVKKIVDAQ